MDYTEKLKDPRWQKKRLEIFERDKWKCKSCNEKEKTLHIHHLFYFKNIEPWEINNGFLITLCEDCHKVEKEQDEGMTICESIIKDIGVLLDSVWQNGYDCQDLLSIAYIINQTKRPIGPAWNGKFIVKRWRRKGHAKN